MSSLPALNPNQTISPTLPFYLDKGKSKHWNVLPSEISNQINYSAILSSFHFKNLGLYLRSVNKCLKIFHQTLNSLIRIFTPTQTPQTTSKLYFKIFIYIHSIAGLKYIYLLIICDYYVRVKGPDQQINKSTNQLISQTISLPIIDARLLIYNT